MRMEKASKDVEGKREQLCLEIRTLLVAAENLSTAQQQLQVGKKKLALKGLTERANESAVCLYMFGCEVDIV